MLVPRSLSLACASVLALSACKDNAPPPSPTYNFANAPPAIVDVNAPASYAGYAPAERAYAFDRVTYRTAPSYGFRYAEEEPWAWRTADDYSMYVEPYDDGYINYYYEPGGDYPYFIRDDDYGYGYGPDGALIAVYDSYGELLPEDRLYALAVLAGSYLVRASAIRRYALDDTYRVVVTDDYWADYAPRYYETQQVWYAAPERQPQWRTWRASHETELAQLLPRGEVRRWNKADDKAWKAYEKADRKAWQAEDRSWREKAANRRNDQQVALAAPQPGPAARGEGRERGYERGPDQRRQMEAQGSRGAGRRDERQMALAGPGPAPREERGNGRQDRRAESPRQARMEAPREQGRHGRPDRVEMATAAPRPNQELRREAPAAERGRGGGHRAAQVATAQPPRSEPAPQRQHGGNPHAEARRGPPMAQAQPQPQPSQPQPQHGGGHGGGRPDRGPEQAAAPAPQAPSGHQGGPAQGGGKPEGKGHGKDK